MLAAARITIPVEYFQIRIFQKIKALRAKEILRPVVILDILGDKSKEAPEEEVWISKPTVRRDF